jgi:hypothetical protein
MVAPITSRSGLILCVGHAGEKGRRPTRPRQPSSNLPGLWSPSRPTGLSPPVYRDQLDYEMIEDGRSIGRMYEDWHALPDLRWFWSITVFVGYRPGVTTHGRTLSLQEAKARFLSSWQMCRVLADKLPQRQGYKAATNAHLPCLVDLISSSASRS